MRIKLIQSHRHRGRLYRAGAEIELREPQAQWLIGNGVAEAVSSVPATTSAKKPVFQNQK